jgi:hypothetical protein
LHRRPSRRAESREKREKREKRVEKRKTGQPELRDYSFGSAAGE